MRLLLILLLTLNLLQAKKIALLIGNNDYSFQPLSNPLHDVDGIYKTLIEIGFEKSNIKVLKNASKTKMESELANFSQRATSAEIALVYFSGHGMQVNNTNYMFPARTTATKPIHLRTLVDLDYFIESASSAKYGIVLVDACRNNPLVKYFQNGKHKGAVAKKGLGQVTPTVGQVVIGFATSAGDTADDGNGNMSPYAKALSVRLKEKDDIRNILGKVGKDVSQKYEQNPVYRTNLDSSVFLMDKWIFPSKSSCTREGGEIKKGLCFATKEETWDICMANKGYVPEFNDIKKFVLNCGGEVNSFSNQNNQNYNACWKEKFSSSYYWGNSFVIDFSYGGYKPSIFQGPAFGFPKDTKFPVLCIKKK